MQELDFWKLSEELTVVQASLLFIGQNPSDHPSIERLAKKPIGYAAIKHAIMRALHSDSIEGRLGFEPSDDFHKAYECPFRSMVSVDSLKSWLERRGFKDNTFYFQNDNIADIRKMEFLDDSHPRYAPKLAAAYNAWKAMDDEKLYKTRSPKQAMKEWLRTNAQQFGLSDSEGKPAQSVIEDIAKIANWKQKGGAPATPI